MASETRSAVDVLVVGAGPTGLLLAGELHRHGVACRLIDKLPAPQPYAKASGVMPRSLEMFEDIGVLDAFLAIGVPVNAFVTCGQGPDALLSLSFKDLDCPFPILLGIEQYSTERILAEHLQGLGGHIERGVELDTFEQHDDGVEARLRHRDGRTEIVAARYLVGCDGAHSVVRHGLGLGFAGAEYPQHFLLGHVRIDWDVPRDESRMYVARAGSFFVFPVPDERWMMVGELAGDQIAQHHEGDPTLADLQRLLDERGPAGARVHDAQWTSYFRIHHRQVERYSAGRVFLAGDAAHIHSPAGGQGMNTGMQDAYNLAWKLGAVLRHGAAPALLASYDAERRPVGKAVLQFTDELQVSAGFRNPVLQEVRNAVMGCLGHLEVVKHHVATQLGETMYSYHKGPLAAEHHASGLRLHEDARHPGFRDCRAFHHGPHGGDLAPDARLNGKRLYEHLRGPQFVALLFEGTHGSQGEAADLVQVARAIEQAHGAWLRTCIVTPHATPPPALAGYPHVLADPDQHTHDRYGARGQCLYLVRPDGYVAWRSLPPDPARLGAYLKGIGLPTALG